MSEPVQFDRDLKVSDVQALSDANAITAFFASLGYDTGLRVAQTPAAMGITADSLLRKISRIERIAGADGRVLQVYLIELDSVTVAALDGFARALRNRAGEYVLVVTSDYEQLHFVLIEREESPTTPTRLSPPQVRVRPRSLALNRRDPGKVKLRVLRRFTYTEADPYAQYEKLSSAYTVAEWAEPLFNNRALVSDYFLTERLPTWTEWADDPRPTYRGLSELYQGVRERFGGQDDEGLRAGLTDPVFDLLGFSASQARGADGPDVWLEVGDGSRVACLIYPWDRYLDGRDEKRDSRRSSDLPGARVVSALQGDGAQWAILTNGKLWRLYSGAAHSTATNYYEIDLEETLASEDPHEAFRYFWLFFRAAAFARGPERQCFLDRLVGESEAFATSLGEELKRRIFEEVFPRLAQGCIAHERTTSPGFEPDQDFLDQSFRATLTLLYRLLFVLFAEARDLLPVREVHGYGPHSLARIKGQLASQAGPIADQREARLVNAYGKDPGSTGLYEALLALFRAIDRGDPSVNLPLYDGGLFISDPDAADDTAEAVAARFLHDHRVPDGELAVALDLLSRDVDRKRGDLVFVDYKSLGVRHLGSIYEGLLEFRLRVAGERMAIVRGKRTEEILPYGEAVRAQRVILREGRGRTAPERTLQAGAVYLENDKSERKATGSYYTPDHIVRYIVDEAVGPALDAHLEQLRPRMREAQQAHQQAIRRAQAFARQGMVGDDPQKVANDPRWIALADDVFEFRVLDPAMGSGHFLVEAVDFITDRLLVFLNGFPWNPVQAALWRTRETIQSELDRQGVSVDATKLNDLNLLKRQVLKRCVYGVDLNPMAVELAKVSLWLDCFTLGAPLSFLDHHLKCGNSLVGTSIGDVERALQVQHGEHYGTLFGGSEFTGIMSAVEMMKIIGGLPDVTPAQVAESRGQFHKASDELAPFKEMLDIYTSRWFGNRPTKTKGGIYDVTVEFLRTEDSRVWLKQGTGIQRVGPLQRKARQVAQAAARAHRFFHWQLEFPEVFFGASAASQQVVQIKPDGGFDAVVGNPPYDVLASEELGYDVSDLVNFVVEVPRYEPAVRGKNNLYKLFICQGLELRRASGGFSFIVPMALLGDEQSGGVRRAILGADVLSRVEAFPQKDDTNHRVFSEAKLSTAVFVARSNSERQFVVRTHAAGTIEEGAPSLALAPSEVLRFDPENAAIPSCSQADWDLANRILSTPAIRRLGDVARQFQGEVNETNERKRGVFTEASDAPIVLRGAAICMYAVREASQGETLRLDVAKFLRGKGEDTKAFAHLRRRVGFQRSAPQNNFRRLIAAPIEPGNYCFDTVSYVTEDSTEVDLDVLVALLNSQILDWYFRLASTNSKVNEYQFNLLPIPSGLEWRPGQSSEANAAELTDLVELCETPGIMPEQVAYGVANISRQIQRIEAERLLSTRSERSSLAAESQQLQDRIDAILFRCYGLSDSDGEYVTKRLTEML